MANGVKAAVAVASETDRLLCAIALVQSSYHMMERTQHNLATYALDTARQWLGQDVHRGVTAAFYPWRG